MIEDFLVTSEGDLFSANGYDAMMRWDGLMPAMEEVGMDAPASALAMSGSGIGEIVGTYYAYTRFLDALGNVSNFSPISAAFDANGSSGTITDASNESPIVITSAAHGITNGQTVKVTEVGGNDAANGTWPITVIDADTFSLDGSSGNGAYNGAGQWISGVDTVTYSSIPVPAEAKVVRRQILRNTDGQATVFYVDIDTDDLSSTILSSTSTDSQLSANEAVPLLNPDGSVFANRHAKPLNYFSYIAQHLDVTFATGIVEYNLGHIKVAFGSTTVTGVGTGWKSTMATRFLYVDGADQTYEIDSIDEAAQTLTLTEAYQGDTDLFAFYAINPPPGYRRALAFSGAGLPQSWLATDTLTIQDTGDKIVGLMQHASFLWILERQHIHKLTFAVSPIKDGGVFMAASRGCVNNRCWVPVDDTVYMLDELGAHQFSGRRQTDQLSTEIQDVFRLDGDSRFHVQWQWKEYFHANLDRQRETIRWFVSLDGNRYPRHALCLQYRQRKWWVEEYPFPIGGSCVSTDDMPRVFYAGQHAKILMAWADTLDVVDSDTGDTRALATSSSAFTLADSNSVWPDSLVNAPISIVYGTGKGQKRRIISVSSQTLVIESPWDTLPDTTSIYQLGGVRWSYRSAWMRFANSEKMADRRFEMLYEVLDSPVIADLRFFSNFQEEPQDQAVTMASISGGGFASTKGLPDLSLDLTRAPGMANKRIPAGKERFIQGKEFVQFELEGDTNKDSVRIYQVSYEGAIPETGLQSGEGQ